MEKDILITESDNSWTNVDNNFNEFVFHNITVHEERKSQIDGISGQSLTFKELFDNARRLATSLQELGVLPGEIISVSCENRLEFSAVLLACLFTGTVFAPINPAYCTGEIVHVLNISKPCVIFCSAFTLKTISQALLDLEGIRHVIILDDISPISRIPLMKFNSLFNALPINKPVTRNDGDIAIILSSSGTTGLPKGVMLSYRNLKYLFSFSRGKNQLNITQNCIILGLIPLYHGYGCAMLLLSVLLGATLVLLPRFEEKLFLSTIQKYKITNLYLVPPLMVFLAKHPMVLQYDLTNVREVVCGAAPLSRELVPEILTRLPAIDIRQGYGMTESSVISTITPPFSNMAHSVGKLAPGLEAKIVDVMTRQPLERGKIGEVWLRGVCVMAGYMNNLQATRDTVDTDGWLHTGDIGYVDHLGYFYIVDRIKELIKYKGFQVAPAELESLLIGIPGVNDAAVIGVPDPSVGELPIAYVVRQPQVTVTREDILNHVNGKVSPQKRLRDVRFIDTIPRNPSGKILRRFLKNALKAKF